MLSSASPIEVVYVVVMLLALGASLANFWWARARRVELVRRGQNGVLREMRRGAEADQMKLVGVCVALVAIGLNSLFAPPNPRAATTTALISGLSFIGLSVVVVWLSISIRIRPARLRHLQDQAEISEVNPIGND
jgi:hypothetical protein